MMRLTRSLWCPLVSGWLSRVAWNDEKNFSKLRADLAHGVQFLYLAYVDARAVGCCTVRVEDHADHREMCVTSMAGQFGSCFLMMKFAHCLDALAKQNNCHVLRGHVERLGLKKLYERHGFTVREFLNNEWVMVRPVCSN